MSLPDGLNEPVTTGLELAPGGEGVSQPSVRVASLLVVVPAWNEERSVAQVVAEVRRHLPAAQVLVVDDGSQDDTAATAQRAGATVLRLPFNLGVGGAMRAGFLYARDIGHDRVVQVDADGQHDPSYIPALLAQLDEGADVVIGARFAGVGDYRVPRLRAVTMRAVSRLMTAAVGRRLTDATSGLRVANRRAIELFAETYPAEYLGDTLQSLLIAHRAGLEIRQVPVAMRPRAAGEPSQGVLGSVLYLSRCAFALVVRKQTPAERALQRRPSAA